jgi:hypothetical protein
LATIRCWQTTTLAEDFAVEDASSDCETFLPEVQRLRQDFRIEQLVVVGDRGMKSIDEISQTNGIPRSRAPRSG